MGMDGLSMANTGRLKESTSLDYSKESEELAKEDTEKSMIVQKLTQQERVNEEKEENKKRRKNNSEKENDDAEEEDEITADDESEVFTDAGEVSLDDLRLVDGENKGFYTKLSKNLENIELYDRITDRLIGTITPDELSYLISKLNMGTGIFINKKV